VPDDDGGARESKCLGSIENRRGGKFREKMRAAGPGVLGASASRVLGNASSPSPVCERERERELKRELERELERERERERERASRWRGAGGAGRGLLAGRAPARPASA
jgi:hypothetical protein